MSESAEKNQTQTAPTPGNGKRRRRHIIGNAWLRIPLKVLMWIVIIVALIPVAIYLPPVQNILKDVACRVIGKSTGMQVSIDRFRLRFPLDVQLDGVLIEQAPGDTMVVAHSLIADVKMRPLLKLDVQVNKLQLLQAKYKMLSADSSMTLRLKAGFLQTDPGTQFNLHDMHLVLNNPVLKDADIAVDMNVWKQKKDTTNTPTKFIIEANKLALSNVTFSLSMLPTIKSLTATIDKADATNAYINLTESKIDIGSLKVDDGNASIIMPTAQYIKTHPAPSDTLSTKNPAPPMTISIAQADIALSNILYATDGAKPQPGFDPSYIEATGINLSMKDFFNQSALLRLPLESFSAKERSGLSIDNASGLLTIDATTLSLENFSLTTPHSSLHADATLPFELMAMNPSAPAGTVKAYGQLGWTDLFTFAPALRSSVNAFLPKGALKPIDFTINGTGTTKSLSISRLKLAMGNFLNLSASGHAADLLNPKKLSAALSFDGAMRDPSLTQQLLLKLASAGNEFRVPSLQIKGKANIHPGLYDADFKLLTSAGNVTANGRIGITPERYDLTADISPLQLGRIMPSLGIGVIAGHISANGSGFDPLAHSAIANVKASLSQLTYQGKQLSPLNLDLTAHSGQYDLTLNADAPDFNLDLTGTGHLEGDTYFVDVNSDIIYADLKELGLIDTTCRGSGHIAVNGNLNPNKMLFDLTMNLDDVDWEYADEFYHLPHALSANFIATSDLTSLDARGDRLNLQFNSDNGLNALMAKFNKAMPVINKQIDQKQFDFNKIAQALPEFNLHIDADGEGLISELIESTGYSISSVDADISNSDKIKGNVKLLALANKSMRLDTISVIFTQQDSLLNYRAHLGNRPDNLPEFSQVNATGYMGGNRGALNLNQRNASGQTGYRIGIDALYQDSILALHLTPADATIAYKPWSINQDNYIHLGPGRKIGAFLEASSEQSSISLRSTESADSLPALDVDIRNLLIQDFINISAFAPPVTGAVNSKMHLVYRGTALTGNGSIGVNELTYNERRVGNFDFNFKAGMAFNGNVGAKLNLLLDKNEVLEASGYFLSDSTAIKSSIKQMAKLNLKLKEFPVSVANPFLDPELLSLSGHLNGDMTLTGSLQAPLLNGSIGCDSVGVYVPMAASWLRFDKEHVISVENNVLNFNDFHIHAASENPFTLNGQVDARKLSDILFDLSLNGNNVALVNNNKRAGSDIYGKLFLTLSATAKGSTQRMLVNGNVQVLPATDIYYTLPAAKAAALKEESTTDVVKFVQFSDTTQVQQADSLKAQTMAMRITASLSIVNGAQITVNLSNNGTDKVQLSPYGTLSFLQTYMGDMRLNGTLYLGTGFASYSIPALGEKRFSINENSYAAWNGDIMNPILNIMATDHVRANVQQEGANSRLIYFDLTANITGTLSAPKILFDLSTNDDLTVENELQGMTAEQRSASAINLLLYNTYTGPGVNATANLGGNPLYSLLEGQLNSLAAKYITGVDLSFGIDQYNRTENGVTSGTTSYSYQVSKSLFDNKFKIVVGGNYSTDANADENFAQNLISDISFEYSIRQTNSTNMYVRLFRHTDFESILEGEVTETGVGFVLKRKLSNLRSLFRLNRRRRATPDSLPADSADNKGNFFKVTLPSDSNRNK